jgi:hypothetical protein
MLSNLLDLCDEVPGPPVPRHTFYCVLIMFRPVDGRLISLTPGRL